MATPDPFARLRLDPDATVPLSSQLAAAIVARIDRGDLAGGDRLPTVRALAERLALAPNTVAKAYRILERDGVIVGRGRLGTFVTDTLAETPSRRAAGLASAARAYVGRARRLGADAEATVTAVRRELER